jgi:hypothetical protein
MKRTPGRTATERAQYWTEAHFAIARAYKRWRDCLLRSARSSEEQLLSATLLCLRALHPEKGNLKDNDKAARDELRTASGEVYPREHKARIFDISAQRV